MSSCASSSTPEPDEQYTMNNITMTESFQTHPFGLPLRHLALRPNLVYKWDTFDARHLKGAQKVVVQVPREIIQLQYHGCVEE